MNKKATVRKPKYWNFREVTLTEVLDWFQGKKMALEHIQAYPGGSSGAYGIQLSDDSQVVSSSEWSGPLSEETPDMESLPPRFWIGDPVYG